MNEETASTNSITLVMVHGVGDAKRGAILADFCDVLSKLKLNPVFREENWLIGKFPYARLAGESVRFGGREIKEMIEVNWADVLRPGEGKVDVLRHLVKMFFALRNLSLARNSNPSAFARFCAEVHWFLVERVCLWISLSVLGVMLLVSSGAHGWKAFAVAGAVAAAMGGIAGLGVWTRRPRYWCGFLWALGFLAIGIGYALAPDTWRLGLVHASANAYFASQLVWGIALNMAFFSTVIAGGGSRAQRAARGGYIWLSFVLMTSLLVLLWLVVLAAAAAPMADYLVWSKAFTGNSYYDFRMAESAMVCAQVFTFVAVPMFGLAVYFSSGLRKLLKFPKWPGPAAHRMVEVFLIAGPCALFTASVYILWRSFTQPIPAESNLWEIYKMSALRIPSLLVFLLPGIRVVADIVGDVLFHVQPKGSEVSSRKATEERLHLLLGELAKRESKCPVVILAHSQGSVVSWTLLKDNPSLADVVVTVGSPLSTLYTRFLDSDFKGPYALPMEWHNLYRKGDYVGGEVEGCPDNRDIGPGVHTDYWNDPVFATHFSECLMKTNVTKPT